MQRRITVLSIFTLLCAPAFSEAASEAPAAARRIDTFLRDLDSDQWAVREKAMRALKKLGPAARPALRQALDTASVEVRWRLQEILRAIRMVESSGQLSPPDGDGGEAIGPYQIHEIYWRDAVAADPDLAWGTYQACRSLDYAEAVIRAYMLQWVPGAWRSGNAEVIARTHNGGPTGAAKGATDGYWEKVQAQLQ